MAISAKIDHYEVFYSSNTFPPRIFLFGGGKTLGQLIFWPDGSVLPVDTLSNNQVNLNYHLANLTTMLTLFRGDQTLFVSFVGSGPGNENAISTSEQILGT